MQVDKLNEFIRFSWDVAKHPVNASPRKDSEVMQRLQHDSGFSPKFKEEPDERSKALLMQSVALPTIMAMTHGKTRTMLEHTKWKDADPEVKQQIFELYEGFIPEDHLFLFHMVRTQQQILLMASYMAATYALTTYTTPLMVDFDDLIRASFHSISGDRTLLNATEKAGLLFVLYPLANYPGIEKVSGPLFTMFAKRSDFGRPTVFLDMPQGEVARKIANKSVPNADDFKKMCKESVTGSTKFGYYLAGPSTYRNFNTPLRGLNVSREAFYF